eukprot:11195794-Lingulodinium_polyedra.AAC.1
MGSTLGSRRGRDIRYRRQPWCKNSLEELPGTTFTLIRRVLAPECQLDSGLDFLGDAGLVE